MKTWTGALIASGVVLVLALVAVPQHAPSREQVELRTFDAALGKSERKARLLTESADEVLGVYVADVEPIERALLPRARDPILARQAAWALVREAKTRHLSPALLAAVLQVENPWLVPDTTSYAGAVGWMQVMPFHAADGDHPCGTDLKDGPTSVCFGADILRGYLGTALDQAIRAALLRYNGCIRTPGCEAYADHVLRRVN